MIRTRRTNPGTMGAEQKRKGAGCEPLPEIGASNLPGTSPSQPPTSFRTTTVRRDAQIRTFPVGSSSLGRDFISSEGSGERLVEVSAEDARSPPPKRLEVSKS